MTKDWVRLGRKLAAARDAISLTQVQIAERIGVTRTPIQSIERGDDRAKITGTMRSYARIVGWADGSTEAVLVGGDPVYVSEAPAEEGAAVAEPRLPAVLRAELSEGEILDHGVYDLTEDGSSRIVVVAIGPEGASADEIKEFMRAWRQRRRVLRQLENEEPPEGS
ncbi:helix-turn-helix transcriptional regulator [Streptomyces sp. NPDC004838]